ncbi:hypothetical protein RDABS01_012561 [Bienertia sinuspersici]
MGLGALCHLKYLWIFSNYRLSGPLFNIIANLTSLEHISAYDNAFMGSIPDNSISRMTNLTVLDLSSNKLSGIIPLSIFNISSLRVLDLGSNQLHGSIPPYIAFALPQLQILRLYNNYLLGPLPLSIQNLTTLQQLNLSKNNFTGRVSVDYGGLHNLQWLSLDNNNFEGDISFIITALVNCTKLNNLHLGKNNFIGVLPKVLANLSTSLTKISIRGASITGAIPIGIGNLINLTHVDMSESEFTGSIPSEFAKLHKLERLYLYSNKLTVYSVYMTTIYRAIYLQALAVVKICYICIYITIIFMDLCQMSFLEECGIGGEASLEADIYSYGILLLELITRKRPTDDMLNEDLNLHGYAKASLPKKVLQIVDSMVLTEEVNEEVDSRVPRPQERLRQREECIAIVLKVGVACSSHFPSDRMKMSQVISKLQKARNILLNPKHRHNLPRGA